ncbi:ORF6N domain-containing protein [Sphingobacterium sp. DN00404]|uniref:ORF6N domain-containing protein n=2 Tax=Sphingobacterium micropteri TaxID=2763501 RepID=A0ABR7YKC7_9SPHI|nr:ORF6N domain-containing protein [Sphingobacterium micropteri]
MSKNETARLTIIEDRIFIIRNQQVMIDKDLADLYAVETKVLNMAYWSCYL